MKKEKSDGERSKRPSFLRVLKTVLAAAIGVQSRKNLEQDSQQASFRHYVAAGLILISTFIATLVCIVLLVVHFTG
ncbi:DUF2970 domain-containing protein [Marinobacter sp. SS8-8]|uniref:DUF2970 domain-containing protein n=1 Tax=Marinobacter sp. SS8-8 TaxID=3050452 RepID=UPI0026E00F99|nr:DUF2970 domain-containing protein [Marinobacter sp. SS8-8]